MRLKEILKRLAEIKKELETRGAQMEAAEVEALEIEVAALQEERTAIEATSERRNQLLSSLAAGNAPEGDGSPAPINTLRGFQGSGHEQAVPADPHNTNEYRTAFMNYVCRNVPMSIEQRANEVITAADAGAVIPTTILNEIISELKTRGNIWAKVRKLSVQGGVSIPVLSIKPTATWIGETVSSDAKKAKADTKITFSYFGVECKIAQTLLASVVTLQMFQDLFVPLCVEAIIDALETAVISGNGTTQPLGITKDSRVPGTNVITMSVAEISSWEAWKKKVFAKMKKSYRDGAFLMAQGTFDGYIDGMVDAVGQPIGRVNYGITNGENYRFGGKAVETVEDDIIANYENAEAGEVIAVFVKLSDYVVNSNMQMHVVKWVDNDTNEVKNKCILICDGKLADPNGVLIIKKGAA